MTAETPAAIALPRAVGSSRPARRRTRAASAGLVLALHLGLLYLASLSLRGSAVRERLDAGGVGMTVGLVGPLEGDQSAAPAAAPTAATTAPVEPASTPAEDAPTDPAPSDPTPPQFPGGAASDKASASASTGSAGGGAGEGVPFSDPRAHASVLPGTLVRSPADAALWLQVSRCWNAQRTHIPLTLAITLDDRGSLLGEPEPVRPADKTPSAPLLAEEAVAAHALKACAPYPVMGMGARREVRFAGDLSRGDLARGEEAR